MQSGLCALSSSLPFSQSDCSERGLYCYKQSLLKKQKTQYQVFLMTYCDSDSFLISAWAQGEQTLSFLNLLWEVLRWSGSSVSFPRFVEGSLCRRRFLVPVCVLSSLWLTLSPPACCYRTIWAWGMWENTLSSRCRLPGGKKNNQVLNSYLVWNSSTSVAHLLS